jgi:hypothetical protein
LSYYKLELEIKFYTNMTNIEPIKSVINRHAEKSAQTSEPPGAIGIII